MKITGYVLNGLPWVPLSDSTIGDLIIIVTLTLNENNTSFPWEDLDYVSVGVQSQFKYFYSFANIYRY